MIIVDLYSVTISPFDLIFDPVFADDFSSWLIKWINFSVFSDLWQTRISSLYKSSVLLYISSNQNDNIFPVQYVTLAFDSYLTFMKRVPTFSNLVFSTAETAFFSCDVWPFFSCKVSSFSFYKIDFSNFADLCAISIQNGSNNVNITSDMSFIHHRIIHFSQFTC